MKEESMMKKRIYVHPTSEVVTLKSEGFVCLSIPIGPGPGPGGGGQAKSFNPDDSEEEMEDVSDYGYENTSLWKK